MYSLNGIYHPISLHLVRFNGAPTQISLFEYSKFQIKSIHSSQSSQIKGESVQCSADLATLPIDDLVVEQNDRNRVTWIVLAAILFLIIYICTRMHTIMIVSRQPFTAKTSINIIFICFSVFMEEMGIKWTCIWCILAKWTCWREFLPSLGKNKDLLAFGLV